MRLRLSTRQKVAIARIMRLLVMIMRRLFGRGANCIVRRRGIRWALDLNEGIDFSIYLLGAFEPGTVKQYLQLLRPDDVVIDIGANIGAHTLHLARAVGEHGRVIAIEPTDYAFSKLNANLALNPEYEHRVITVQAMLTSGAVDRIPEPVYSSWPLSGNADDTHPLHLGQLMSCNGARTTTLDSLVKGLGLMSVAMLKIDIDGNECDMLQGATDTLSRFRPNIVMELAPYVLAERGASLKELVSLLQVTRFRLVDMDTRDPLPLDVMRLAAMIPAGSCRNVLALPE